MREDGRTVELDAGAKGSGDRAGRTDDGRVLACQYDAALGPEATQADVFEQVQGAVEQVCHGVNATVFAYGQTGTGKTHTMLGDGLEGLMAAGSASEVAGAGARERWGVLPRAVDSVFQGIASQRVPGREQGNDDAVGHSPDNGAPGRAVRAAAAAWSTGDDEAEQTTPEPSAAGPGSAATERPAHEPDAAADASVLAEGGGGQAAPEAGATKPQPPAADASSAAPSSEQGAEAPIAASGPSSPGDTSAPDGDGDASPPDGDGDAPGGSGPPGTSAAGALPVEPGAEGGEEGGAGDAGPVSKAAAPAEQSTSPLGAAAAEDEKAAAGGDAGPSDVASAGDTTDQAPEAGGDSEASRPAVEDEADDEGSDAGAGSGAAPPTPANGSSTPRTDTGTGAGGLFVSDAAVVCSYLQVYNGRVFDLLADASRARPLVLREGGAAADAVSRPVGSEGAVYVAGLTEHRVSGLRDVLELLAEGTQNRARRATEHNEASSRSHAVLRLEVTLELRPERQARAVERARRAEAAAAEAGEGPGAIEAAEELAEAAAEAASVLREGGGTTRAVVRRSVLTLVDLAGSEKWDTRPGATRMTAGRQRELTAINSSLSALGNCISALVRKRQRDDAMRRADAAGSPPPRVAPVHVPYRDSPLTRLLQDSLGGNCRTVVVATLGPGAAAAEESVSTLHFADRASRVLVRVRVNEVVDDREKLLRARREVSRLRKALKAFIAVYGGTLDGPFGKSGAPPVGWKPPTVVVVARGAAVAPVLTADPGSAVSGRFRGSAPIAAQQAALSQGSLESLGQSPSRRGTRGRAGAPAGGISRSSSERRLGWKPSKTKKAGKAGRRRTPKSARALAIDSEQSGTDGMPSPTASDVLSPLGSQAPSQVFGRDREAAAGALPLSQLPEEEGALPWGGRGPGRAGRLPPLDAPHVVGRASGTAAPRHSGAQAPGALEPGSAGAGHQPAAFRSRRTAPSIATPDPAAFRASGGPATWDDGPRLGGGAAASVASVGDSEASQELLWHGEAEQPGRPREGAADGSRGRASGPPARTTGGKSAPAARAGSPVPSGQRLAATQEDFFSEFDAAEDRFRTFMARLKALERGELPDEAPRSPVPGPPPRPVAPKSPSAPPPAAKAPTSQAASSSPQAPDDRRHQDLLARALAAPEAPAGLPAHAPAEPAPAPSTPPSRIHAAPGSAAGSVASGHGRSEASPSTRDIASWLNARPSATEPSGLARPPSPLSTPTRTDHPAARARAGGADRADEGFRPPADGGFRAAADGRGRPSQFRPSGALAAPTGGQPLPTPSRDPLGRGAAVVADGRACPETGPVASPAPARGPVDDHRGRTTATAATAGSALSQQLRAERADADMRASRLAELRAKYGGGRPAASRGPPAGASPGRQLPPPTRAAPPGYLAARGAAGVSLRPEAAPQAYGTSQSGPSYSAAPSHPAAAGGMPSYGAGGGDGGGGSSPFSSRYAGKYAPVAARRGGGAEGGGHGAEVAALLNGSSAYAGRAGSPLRPGYPDGRLGGPTAWAARQSLAGGAPGRGSGAPPSTADSEGVRSYSTLPRVDAGADAATARSHAARLSSMSRPELALPNAGGSSAAPRGGWGSPQRSKITYLSGGESFGADGHVRPAGARQRYG